MERGIREGWWWWWEKGGECGDDGGEGESERVVALKEEREVDHLTRRDQINNFMDQIEIHVALNVTHHSIH